MNRKSVDELPLKEFLWKGPVTGWFIQSDKSLFKSILADQCKYEVKGELSGLIFEGSLFLTKQGVTLRSEVVSRVEVRTTPSYL